MNDIEILEQFLAKNISDTERTRFPYEIPLWDDKENLRGCVLVSDEYGQPNDKEVELKVISNLRDDWNMLNRETIKMMYNYIFTELEVERVVMNISLSTKSEKESETLRKRLAVMNKFGYTFVYQNHDFFLKGYFNRKQWSAKKHQFTDEFYKFKKQFNRHKHKFKEN